MSNKRTITKGFFTIPINLDKSSFFFLQRLRTNDGFPINTHFCFEAHIILKICETKFIEIETNTMILLLVPY